MTPTIHVIRHAQGLHNLNRQFGGNQIRDAYLTALGLQQCVDVQRTFPFTPDLILSSPLKRTIQTSLYCFGPTVLNNGPVILVPDLQAAGNFPCNIGSPVSELKKEFQGAINEKPYGQDENWFNNPQGLSFANEQLQERITRARRVIQAHAILFMMGQNPKPNANIIVVTHGEMIPWLVGDTPERFQENNSFRNAEWRSYQFTDLLNRAGSSLLETDQSRQRRGAPLVAPTTQPAPPRDSNTQGPLPGDSNTQGPLPGDSNTQGPPPKAPTTQGPPKTSTTPPNDPPNNPPPSNTQQQQELTPQEKLTQAWNANFAKRVALAQASKNQIVLYNLGPPIIS